MVLCSLIYGFVCVLSCRKRYRDQGPPKNAELQIALNFVPRYSFAQLKKATHGFSDKYKIGEGGFSTVYKGTFSDGSVVAVKKLKESLRKETDFCSEINIVSKIRHKNLLQLQGWCYERGEAMLLYKFMANGSLDKLLFCKRKGCLDRNRRLRILAGVASALEHLHNGLGNCVLHRDVKAANVLLTDDFEPMLCDFGLARLINHEQAMTITYAGTPGYVAPELLYIGKATDKADVYSYGVLALEVACGRKACMRSEEMSLISWIWKLHETGQDIIEALDPTIRTSMSSREKYQWRCVLHVALMCYNPIAADRPTMRQVTQVIQNGVLLPLPPRRPEHPFTIEKSADKNSKDSWVLSDSLTMPR